ncbi:MAG TPA: hypothetical protein DCX65_00245, partial [Spirochaetaceae bacterium]|nr:hypothetical protein [Spirochaetaceae bacterium]
MSSSVKAIISFLLAALLAVAFGALGWSGLFDYIETRFFDQRVRRQVDSGLDGLAAAVDDWHEGNLTVWQDLFNQDFLRRAYLPNQTAEDIFQRSDRFGRLQAEVPGFLGSRILDQDGSRIHFS